MGNVGQELVCTAGVTQDGKWIRLYPVDYRYRPKHQQFTKYQWIDVVLDDAGHGHDKRPESRRPNLESIQIIGERLDTKNNWAARRAIVDAMSHRTLNEFKVKYDTDRTSLGIGELVKSYIRRDSSEVRLVVGEHHALLRLRSRDLAKGRRRMLEKAVINIIEEGEDEPTFDH